MIGLILCGGQSTRMGTDKGLLTMNKKVTWAQHCFSLLAKLKIPVGISVNRMQYDQYKSIFPLQKLIMDNDDLNIHGPLLGLLSVHLKHPDNDIFILACDMVAMNALVLNHLYDYYLQQHKNNTCVYANSNAPEPLCAIYKAKDLEKILRSHKSGSLQKHSLKYCLENLNIKLIEIPSDWKESFKNFNTPVSVTHQLLL